MTTEEMQKQIGKMAYRIWRLAEEVEGWDDELVIAKNQSQKGFYDQYGSRIDGLVETIEESQTIRKAHIANLKMAMGELIDVLEKMEK